MKKTITLSIVSVMIAFAGTPFHDKMDTRLKGKSFGGTINDDAAAQDGLGAVVFQHHSGSTEVNNELTAQKVLDRIISKETDPTKRANIKEALNNGLVGTAEDKNLVDNIYIGDPIAEDGFVGYLRFTQAHADYDDDGTRWLGTFLSGFKNAKLLNYEYSYGTGGLKVYPESNLIKLNEVNEAPHPKG